MMSLLTLCLWSSAATAQIDVNETGLHDGQPVVAFLVPNTPIPYLNSQDVVFQVRGETDPNLYADTSFFAYTVVADVNLVNVGVIDVNAIGGVALASDGPASGAIGHVRGISADQDLTSTGAIRVTAVAGRATSENGSATTGIGDAQGILARGDANVTGDIVVTARAGIAIATGGSATTGVHDAIGVRALGDANNTGDITVTALGGTADSSDWQAIAGVGEASGVRADGDVRNSGDITIMADGGTADGHYRANAQAHAWGIEAGNDVNNTGRLLVTAFGGIADANESANAEVFAYGIRAGGNVANSGDIGATVIEGTARGATAQAGSYAYGIYMNGDGTLTHTGTIRVSGDTAYEVYVNSGTTTLVDTYNVALDGDPNDAAFGVAHGAALALNDATLTVTRVAGETLWDTEYRLFETEGNGVVDGNFADVESVHPHTTAVYNTQGTGDAADDTVALSFTPTASAFAGSTAVERQLLAQSGDVIDQRMTGALLNRILAPSGSGLLADAGPTGRSLALSQSAPKDETLGFFLEPYYSRMDQDADPMGYHARLWGFSAGYERRLDDTSICLHAGHGQADVDYTGTGFTSNSEEQGILNVGASGLTRRDEWTLRYGVSAFYAWHDYRGMTGLTLAETETASVNSYGLAASAMAGRIIRRGSHVLLPEVGFNYLWGRRPGYTTQASDSTWNTKYSATDEHDVEAQAALHWMTGFTCGDMHVAPSASIGVRHLLTDEESAVSLSVPGAAPVSVKSERDRTALTLSGSVVLRKTRHSLSLAYDGEYSPDTERHSLWLRYGWQF